MYIIDTVAESSHGRMLRYTVTTGGYCVLYLTRAIYHALLFNKLIEFPGENVTSYSESKDISTKLFKPAKYPNNCQHQQDTISM